MDYSRLVEALRKEGSNKICFDCGVVGTTYASLNFGTFVCSQCAGILRGLNFKVKALGISIFTLDEYEFLQKNGNDKAKNIWLGNFDPYRYQKPNPKSYEEVKEHIIKKYKEKKFYKESKGIRFIKSSIEDDIRDPLDFVDRCRIKNIDIGPSWMKKKDINEEFDFSNNNNNANVRRKNNFIQFNNNRNNNNNINSKKINDYNMNKNSNNNNNQNKNVDLLGGLLDIGQETNNNNNLGNQGKKSDINDLFDGFNFNGNYNNNNNNSSANLTNNSNAKNIASNTNIKNENNLGFDFNSFGNDLNKNSNDDNFFSQKKEEPQNDNFGFDFGDEKPQNEIKKDSNNILDLEDNNQKTNDLLDFNNNKQNINTNNNNKNDNIFDLNNNTSNQANQAMNNNNNDNFDFNFNSNYEQNNNIGFNFDLGQQNQNVKNDNSNINDNFGFDFGEQPQKEVKKEEKLISNLSNDKNGNLGLDLDFEKQTKEEVKEPNNINQLFEDPNREKINDMRKIQEMKRNKDYQDLTVALDNQNQLDKLNQGKLDLTSLANTQNKNEEQAKENSSKEEVNLNFDFDKFLNTQQNNN